MFLYYLEPISMSLGAYFFNEESHEDGAKRPIWRCGRKGSLVPKDEPKAQGFVLVYPDTKSKHTDNK